MTVVGGEDHRSVWDPDRCEWKQPHVAAAFAKISTMAPDVWQYPELSGGEVYDIPEGDEYNFLQWLRVGQKSGETRLMAGDGHISIPRGGHLNFIRSKNQDKRMSGRHERYWQPAPPQTQPHMITGQCS